MPPLIISLNDSEIDQLMTACTPLPPDRRGEFLIEVAAALQGTTIGPGTIHRTVASLQRRYLNSSDLDHARGRKVGKYARG